MALVSLHGLALPGSGRTYELWIVPAGAVAQPAGTFLPEEDGTKLLVVSRQLPVGTQIAVTLEPLGGSPQPTSTPLVAGRI